MLSPESQFTTFETPHGFGFIEVESSDSVVCQFQVITDEGDHVEETRVIDKALVHDTNHPAFPRGIIIWYQEELCDGQNIIATCDTYYAKY